MKQFIFVVWILVFIITGCGSGTQGTGTDPNPPDPPVEPDPPDPPDPNAYDRNGVFYMPTSGDKDLTYAVTDSTPWEGGLWGDINSCWEDINDTTYTKEFVVIEGTPETVMIATPPRDQRYSSPVFRGTQCLGLYYIEDTFEEYVRKPDAPILLLPEILPDIGVEWDASSVIRCYSCIYFEFSVKGKILGVETVTVPAGTYDNALKVEYTGDCEMGESGFFLVGSATVWYVPGIGPVKGVGFTPVTEGVEVVLKAIGD